MKSVKEYIYENEEKQGTNVGAFFILLVVFVLLWLYLFKPDNLWEKLATFAVLSYFLLSSTRKVKKEVTTTDDEGGVSLQVSSRIIAQVLPFIMMRNQQAQQFQPTPIVDGASDEFNQRLRDCDNTRSPDTTVAPSDASDGPSGDRHVGRFDNVLGDER